MEFYWPTQDADSDGDYDGKLSFEEFCSLFKELASRPELRRLFYLYSSKMEWWTVQDLQRFLQTEQGECILFTHTHTYTYTHSHTHTP